jgi:hypothetical protein
VIGPRFLGKEPRYVILYPRARVRHWSCQDAAVQSRRDIFTDVFVFSVHFPQLYRDNRVVKVCGLLASSCHVRDAMSCYPTG